MDERTNEQRGRDDGTRRVDEEEEEGNNGRNGMADEQGKAGGDLRTNERTSEQNLVEEGQVRV